MTRRDIDEATERHLRAQVKEQLRRRMQGLRRVLPQEARAARSLAICARLSQLPALAEARTVVVYHATSREANPAAFAREAEAAGKTIGLPRIDPDGRIQLRQYQSSDALERSNFGIEEPLTSAPVIADEAVDLIIIPALAFDERGHRIGYGQGHYDRLLPRLGRAFKVVIGYDFQHVVQTPDMPGDVAANCVVTDARTLFVE